MGLKKGHDYTGSGPFHDPIVFAAHVNYFVGFQEFCREWGLDPDARRTLTISDGRTFDAVDLGTTRLHFLAPAPSTFAPPLAWQLFSAQGPAGDVTWRGGTDLEIKTGPNITELLRQTLAEPLRSGAPGIALDATMAMLRTISDGAIWSQKVPRERVLEVLVGKPERPRQGPLARLFARLRGR